MVLPSTLFIALKGKKTNTLISMNYKRRGNHKKINGINNTNEGYVYMCVH